MGIFDSSEKKRTKGSLEERRENPPKGQPTLARWHVGDTIADQYEIHRISGGPGRSGMGIVYLCYAHESKRAIAIKTLQDQFLQSRGATNRFKWEAEAWVRLEKHYNTVQAEFVVEIERRPYIFLEYIVGDDRYGVDLLGWIRGGGLERGGKPDIRLILSFAIQFCHGMMHAQRKFAEMGRPFVHRDIKPSNILITRHKVVKITDFGLVKAFLETDEDIPSMTVGDESRRRLSFSKSGIVCGTPPYMSPEQCRGEKDVDVRSDVYAFGCVLYEMLTRRHVFDGGTAEEFIRHHVKDTPKSPDAHRELDRVVLKCLHKDPHERYQDFSELEKVLSVLYGRLTGEVVKQPEGVESEAWELAIKGLSLSNLGIHEEAVACLMQAVELDPNDPDMHDTLGVIYHRQGNHEGAILEYQESLRSEPNNAVTHLNLGITYEHQKNLDAAAAEYKEALRIDPRYAQAHRGLGHIYYSQLRLDDAEREYNESLSIDPSNAEVHCDLGGLYQLQAMLVEAQEEYRKALRIDPDFAFARYKWGTAYLSAYRGIGKPGNPVYLDAAVEQFKEALRLNPDDVDAHYDLGYAYKAQGRLDAAVAEYRELLRLKPNAVDAHRSLGIIYQAQGKYREAIESYQAFVRLAPPQYASRVKQAEESIRQLSQNM